MPTDTPHDALREAGCASLAAAFCALLFLGASAWHLAAQREADSARAALLATRLSPEATAPAHATAERDAGAHVDPDRLARRAEAAQGSARRAALALMVAGLAPVLVLAMVCAAATRRAIRRWRRAEGLAAGWRS